MQGRFRSVALFAALALVSVAPSASASSPDRSSSSPTATKLRVDSAPAFREQMVMTIDTIEMVAGIQVVQLSPRTRDSIQISAVNFAVSNAVRSGDVDPGSFNRAIIDALVDECGPEVAAAVARSYRPQPDAYRNVLHAIRNRSFASSRARD